MENWFKSDSINNTLLNKKIKYKFNEKIKEKNNNLFVLSVDIESKYFKFISDISYFNFKTYSYKSI